MRELAHDLANLPYHPLTRAVTEGGGGGGFVPVVTDGVLHPSVTFTRSTTGTYIDAAGLRQTAAINAPRIGYDPATHALLGLLIEPARTNLLLNSDTLATQSVTVTAQAYTLSFEGAGTVTLSGTSTAGPLVGAGTGPANRVSLTFTPTAGALTLTVSGSVTFAQLEVGNNATSYIPTAGSAVTRALDVAKVADLTRIRYNQPEGTIYCESVHPVLYATSVTLWSANEGVGNELIKAVRTSGGNLSATVVDGGVAQAAFSGAGAFVANAIGKGVTRYQLNNIGTSLNRNTVATDLTATIPTPTLLELGATTALAPLGGYLKTLRYYPRALSDSEMIGIQALGPNDIAAWGDSLTVGAADTISGGYPARLSGVLTRSYYNGGVGGETSTQIATRCLADTTGLHNSLSLFWMGRNNYNQPTTIKADIAACVASLPHSRYLVYSVLTASTDLPADTAAVVALNSDLSALYGTRYVDVLGYLQTKGDGSTNDNADIAAGLVPRSLRSDTVHLNAAGYALVAGYVGAKVLAMGW